MVTYSSDTTELYDYGTTATYQCDSGYELTGGDTVRTCTGDGSSPVDQWNGTAPACTGKQMMLFFTKIKFATYRSCMQVQLTSLL